MIIHSENRFVKYFFLTTLFFYFSSSMNLKDPLFCLFYKCNRLSCDCKLLVGRDHTDFYFGICCGDHFFLSVYFVCLCIYCNSKISKIAADFCSYKCTYSSTFALTIVVFSPIPAVNAIASTPFIAATYAPIYFATR